MPGQFQIRTVAPVLQRVPGLDPVCVVVVAPTLGQMMVPLQNCLVALAAAVELQERFRREMPPGRLGRLGLTFRMWWPRCRARGAGLNR